MMSTLVDEPPAGDGWVHEIILSPRRIFGLSLAGPRRNPSCPPAIPIPKVAQAVTDALDQNGDLLRPRPRETVISLQEPAAFGNKVPLRKR